jgi:ATP-binding cassette subfamily C (CFTR/MRP) protein 4
VVGRTGAGKSSIVASLFRLTEISGDIYIDGISSNSMPLESLRSKISIIPQDPILFFGTVRRNLDPFGEHPDFILWRALEEVRTSWFSYKKKKNKKSKKINAF